MSPKQSGPGVGLISIVNAFSLCSGRRDEARCIAINIEATAVLDRGASLTGVTLQSVGPRLAQRFSTGIRQGNQHILPTHRLLLI